jgi:DNA helicase-2/ATP-dependent DNA helicase PcrA
VNAPKNIASKSPKVLTKGMQWDYVFVVGVTDGVLPDSRSKSKEQLDEERRRLLYVAVTRARQRACLHHAPMWSRHARQTFTEESRFMLSKAVKAAVERRTTQSSYRANTCAPVAGKS